MLQRAILVTGVAGLILALVPPAVAYPRAGRTEVVSLNNAGVPAGGNSGIVSAAASADLSVVAYWTSTNIDPDDTLGASMDLYARDRRTARTIWVSRGPGGGGQYHGSFTEPSVSADGRYVAFGTTAPMVFDDLNGTTDIFVRDLVTDTTEMISNLEPGLIVTGAASPDISGDGRFVAYVQGPHPAATEILLRDRQEKTTEVVSIGASGEPLSGVSSAPALSADGRYVAFSYSPKPTAGVPHADILIRDLEAGTTEVIAPGLSGLPTLDGSWPRLALSADGRYVAFVSDAPNLVPADTNGAPDVFVHDRQTGVTERVSVGSAGTQAEGTMYPPVGGTVVPEGPSASCVGGTSLVGASGFSSSAFASISADGRYVSFISISGNLVAGDTNRCWDAFVHDRTLRTTERVSVSSTGQQGVRAAFGTPPISSDGRLVAFHHFSSIAPEDTNTSTDTYVRDRGPEIGAGELEAEVVDGSVHASGWATFSGSIVSTAADPAGDAGVGGPLGADLTGASLAYRHEPQDLLVRLPVASMPPQAGALITYGMRFTVAGTAYEARIDASGATLHRCTPTCAQVGGLQGSIGTTGSEALIVVPRGAVGAGAGATITGIRAFTTGAGQELDSVDLPAGEIPAATVSLGIAPAGTDEDDVELSAVADLSNAAFTGTIDVSSLPAGGYEVWAWVCLGDRCGSAQVPVTLV